MADKKKPASKSIFDEIFNFEVMSKLLPILAVLFLFLFYPNLLYSILSILVPIIGIAILARIAFIFWRHYVQQKFISGIDFALLEITPPREVLTSPKAMELFFTNALYHFSIKGLTEEYWQGAVWFWYSLEIASIDGQVHFYIRTPTRIRSLIETQMYAQYPQCQVREVEDYTLAVDEISEKSSWNAWGCEFGLLKPEAFPLRTYVDFGLDKDPKEEYKVDPISPVIEFFGSLKKDEQAWLQIVVRPSKKTFPTKGTLFGTHDWVEESKFLIKKFLKPFTRLQVGIDGGTAQEIRVPEFYKKTLEAMSTKTTKLGFDTGVRLIYVAKKEAFDVNNRRASRLIFRQYANPDSNQLWRVNSTQPDAFFLSIVLPNTITRLTDRMVHEYKERAFFHLPLRHHILSKHYLPWPISPLIFPAYFHPNVFVLNVEELATIWHFPGQTLKVPTLTRIESKEASPPPNLPI